MKKQTPTPAPVIYNPAEPEEKALIHFCRADKFFKQHKGEYGLLMKFIREYKYPRKCATVQQFGRIKAQYQIWALGFSKKITPADQLYKGLK